MNYKGESGSYEILHPKNVSNISLASQELQELFDLSNENTVDDAFEYVSRQLILMKYNKAGINVTVKSTGGSPLEGVPIPNITANYDGTGTVETDSQGKAFGYCDAGSVNIAPVACADVAYTSQSVQTLAGEMYNVEITGTVTNFQKYTSSTSIQFSKNVQSVDATIVGGGGGGGGHFDDTEEERFSELPGGGGGGYCKLIESFQISPLNNYQVVVGTGGNGGKKSSDNGTIGTLYGNPGVDGGNSSIFNTTVNGGKGGGAGGKTDTSGKTNNGGAGNGKGGDGGKLGNAGGAADYEGSNGVAGTISGYSSFTDTVIYGGGGGGCGNRYTLSLYEGAGYGGQGGDSAATGRGSTSGQNGFGGGGGAGRGDGSKGGSGCVTIRMHLKVTS